MSDCIEELLFVGKEGVYRGFRKYVILGVQDLIPWSCQECEGVLRDPQGCNLCAPCCGHNATHLNSHLTEGVNKLMCKCPLQTRGCDWSGELSGLMEHMGVCGYLLVPCPLGCKLVLSRDEVSGHIEDNCPQKPAECPFNCVGCKVTQLCRENVSAHMESSVLEHQSLLLRTMIGMRETNLHNREVIVGQSRTLKHHDVMVNQNQTDILEHKQTILETKQTIEQHNKSILNQRETIFANRDSLVRYGQSVRLHDKTAESQNEKIEQQNEKIESQNEKIESQNEKIDKQNEKIEKQNEKIEKQNEKIEKQNEKIEKQNEKIEQQNEKIEQLHNKIESQNEAIKQLHNKIESQNEAIKQLHNKIESQNEAIKQLHNKIESQNEAIKQLHNKIESQNEAIKQLHNKIESQNEAIKQLHNKIESQNEAIKQLHNKIESQNEAIKQLHNKIESQNEAIKQLHNKIESQNEAIKQLHDKIESQNEKIEKQNKKVIEQNKTLEKQDKRIYLNSLTITDNEQTIEEELTTFKQQLSACGDSIALVNANNLADNKFLRGLIYKKVLDTMDWQINNFSRINFGLNPLYSQISKVNNFKLRARISYEPKTDKLSIAIERMSDGIFTIPDPLVIYWKLEIIDNEEKNLVFESESQKGILFSVGSILKLAAVNRNKLITDGYVHQDILLIKFYFAF